MRPVPTVGGQVILPGGNAVGPRHQRVFETRDDVLVYSTPVLDRPVEVIGPIELRLFVASSARETDFTGNWVNVSPDGRAMILTEGILPAPYRKSLAVPRSPEAGRRLRAATGPVDDGECVSARPPHPPGSLQQQPWPK
jgi:predicted acyl esterase